MTSYRVPAMPHGYSPEGLKFEDLESLEAEWSGETGEIFSEAEVSEMAARLLDVRNEKEFDRVLGGILSHAGEAIGEILTSSLGKALGALLKSLAKKSLPPFHVVTRNKLQRHKFINTVSTPTGKILGMELEGLGQDEAEFEVAKRYIRFVGDAVRNAIEAAPMADPTTVASSALTSAANAYAPGLLITLAPGSARTGSVSPNKSSGRWVQFRNKIVVLDV